MPKEPKTRVPKSKPEAEKSEKKKRNVKKDTPEIINTALLGFASARLYVDDAVGVEISEEMPANELLSAIKSIKAAQSALKGARATISNLRNSPWRESMLNNLSQWDKDLDTAWDSLTSGLEDD